MKNKYIINIVVYKFLIFKFNMLYENLNNDFKK